ncbi:Protein of unknown function, partial [Gryllus bimaculatus]
METNGERREEEWADDEIAWSRVSKRRDGTRGIIGDKWERGNKETNRPDKRINKINVRRVHKHGEIPRVASESVSGARCQPAINSPVAAWRTMLGFAAQPGSPAQSGVDRRGEQLVRKGAVRRIVKKEEGAGAEGARGLAGGAARREVAALITRGARRRQRRPPEQPDEAARPAGSGRSATRKNAQLPPLPVTGFPTRAQSEGVLRYAFL